LFIGQEAQLTAQEPQLLALDFGHLEPCHRWLARHKEAKASFRQLFPVKKRGMTLVRRRSSRKLRSSRFVVRIRL
jgi:hypothetical protein